MIKNELLISCPCCGETIKVLFDNSGNPAVFLLDKRPISRSELAEKYGIELGIVEGGEK